MTAASRADPFAVTADPAAYVPRPAAEMVLEGLVRALLRGRRCCALTGPPGIGKTMLLRMLQERLGNGARCVLVPYAALDIEELCRWVLSLLDEPCREGLDPARELLRAAQRSQQAGRPLVVMVDDASLLAPETARRWMELADEGAGALRLVVAPVDDRHAGRVLAALGPEALEIRLSTPMTAGETQAFVRQRLASAEVPPALAARFDGRVMSWIQRMSGGNPRHVQTLASEVLRVGPPTIERELEIELDTTAWLPPPRPSRAEGRATSPRAKRSRRRPPEAFRLPSFRVNLAAPPARRRWRLALTLVLAVAALLLLLGGGARGKRATAPGLACAPTTRAER